MLKKSARLPPARAVSQVRPSSAAPPTVELPVASTVEVQLPVAPGEQP